MAQSHSELPPFHDLGIVTGAASAGATLAAAANSHARLLLRSHVDGRQRPAATPSVNGITDELGLLPSSAAVVSSAHDRVSGSGTSSLDISRFGTLTEMSVDDTASKSLHQLPSDGRNALMDLKLPLPYNSAHEKTTSVHQAAHATSSASTELCRNLAAPHLMDGHTAWISEFPKDYASRETMETFSSSSRDMAASHERVCALASKMVQTASQARRPSQRWGNLEGGSASVMPRSSDLAVTASREMQLRTDVARRDGPLQARNGRVESSGHRDLGYEPAASSRRLQDSPEFSRCLGASADSFELRRNGYRSIDAPSNSESSVRGNLFNRTSSAPSTHAAMVSATSPRPVKDRGLDGQGTSSNDPDLADCSADLIEALQSKYEGRFQAMESEMIRVSEAGCAETAALHGQLLNLAESRQACLEERVAAIAASERRAQECRELWDELASSRAHARESELAAQRAATDHHNSIQQLRTELLEAQHLHDKDITAEHSGRRELARILVLGQQQLLAALHGLGPDAENRMSPHMCNEIESIASRLHQAASELAIGGNVSRSGSLEAGSEAGVHCMAQAAATVEQLSMLAAHLIRAQTAPPWHVELTKMVSLLSGLLNLGRVLSRAAVSVIKRVQRLGIHIAAGRLVRCTKAGAVGKAAYAIWAGEWVPFNTELPMVEHAVAAWHTGSADARSELAKYQHALTIDCTSVSVGQQPSVAEQGLAATDQAIMAQGLLQLANKPSAESVGSLRPV